MKVVRSFGWYLLPLVTALAAVILVACGGEQATPVQEAETPPTATRPRRLPLPPGPHRRCRLNRLQSPRQQCQRSRHPRSLHQPAHRSRPSPPRWLSNPPPLRRQHRNPRRSRLRPSHRPRQLRLRNRLRQRLRRTPPNRRRLRLRSRHARANFDACADAGADRNTHAGPYDGTSSHRGTGTAGERRAPVHPARRCRRRTAGQPAVIPRRQERCAGVLQGILVTLLRSAARAAARGLRQIHRSER